MKTKNSYQKFSESLIKLCKKHKIIIVGAYSSVTDNVPCTAELGKYGHVWLKEEK